MKRISSIAAADIQILYSLRAKYGASTLLKAIKANPRGAPKKLKVGQYGLVLSTDFIVDEYVKQGFDLRKARQLAKIDAMEALSWEDARGKAIGRRRALDLNTFDRYYRQGVKELRDGEIRLARETDIAAAQQGVKGIDLAKAGADVSGTGGVIWLRYLRGKAAASRKKQDKK